MTAVIEIVGLRKTFRSWRRAPKVALDGFDMSVEAGQVHGFLGPNGSGKTTTLRALLGLVNPDGGQMRVLGTPSADYASVAHRIGAIVESPQFFGNFSGDKTLRLLATAGGVPGKRVEEVLSAVGLSERRRDPVRTYSLGMKQRLAVAAALLKEPELLILDEPANGLDPAGIHEMRALVRDLSSRGVTVLISSHLLSEIEQICDSVTIISRGRRISHGPVGQVMSRYDKGEYRVCAGDIDHALRVLTEHGGQARVDAGTLVVSEVSDAAWITQTLGQAGIWLTELSPLTPDLESVFLDITSQEPVLPAQPRDLEIEVSR